MKSVGGMFLLFVFGIWFIYDYESLKAAVIYGVSGIIDLTFTLIEVAIDKIGEADVPGGSTEPRIDGK